MSKEIERKYLIKEMPNLKNIKPIRYERYYINDNIDNQIRAQKKADKFILETKTKINDIEYKKEKQEITEQEFLKLIKDCKKVIIRDSYLINEKPNITIKVYHGIYKGLIRAEIEFDNEYEYSNFKIPEWFGKDITNIELGMDARLIKLDRGDFLEILRKEENMEEKIYINSTDNIKLCALMSNVSVDKVVLLCHGIRGDKYERGSFTTLAKEIMKQGYSTVRIDFRGHGESSGIDYEMTISKEIEDVESVIEFLKSKGYKEIIVLGASFGASIVSLVDYSKFVEVKALILWYGALDNYDVLRTDNFLSERNKQIALKEGFYKSYNKAGKLFRFGIPLFEEINIYKPKDKIKTINLPKLFVHGLADETVSYKVSLEVHNKCSNSKLELIENGSHTFDSDNKALKNAVDKTVEFIKEILQ